MFYDQGLGATKQTTIPVSTNVYNLCTDQSEVSKRELPVISTTIGPITMEPLPFKSPSQDEQDYAAVIAVDPNDTGENGQNLNREATQEHLITELVECIGNYETLTTYHNLYDNTNNTQWSHDICMAVSEEGTLEDTIIDPHLDKSLQSLMEDNPLDPPVPLPELDIPKEHIPFMDTMIERYPNAFGLQAIHMGQCRAFTYQLLTTKHHPYVAPTYRLSEREHRIVEEQVNKMLTLRVIRPSSSPYRNPIFVITKKDGTGRFVLDARRLNEILIKDQFPIPHVRDLLDQLKDARVFSHIDLRSGYWQVALAEEDRPKTAFATRSGLYEFCVMPFGTATAPAAFQRLIQTVFQDLATGVLIYIDDLIIFTKTVEEHIRLLTTVFHRLDEARLCIQPSKCSFLQPRVHVLGHVVSADGIEVDPSKVQAMSNYPKPTTVHALRRFLGSINYYREFVSNYATIASPLYALLLKDAPWVWNDSCQQAFERLITCLTSAPILVQPDFLKPFIIVSDASTHGLGGYLAQAQATDPATYPANTLPPDLKVITYASRTLHGAERNYSATELEALAILYNLNKFRVYVFGHAVHVYTDHAALVHIIRNPFPASPRLTKFVARVMEFDPIIHYTKGDNNTLADALSRIYTDDLQPPAEDTTNLVLAIIPEDESHTNQLIMLQNQDQFCQNLRANPADSTVIVRGVIYRRSAQNGETVLQLVVPKQMRTQILNGYHTDPLGGHLGITSTFNKIRKKYYWPSYHYDVIQHIQKCILCQQTDKRKVENAQPNFPIPIADVFDRVGIDVVGPLPPTERGNKYVIVIVDHGTRWTEAFAVTNTTATTVADILYSQIICRYGPPSVLLSDRGTNFLSKVIKHLCDLFSIEKVQTTAYHPQCNGLVERTNGSLMTLIRKICQDNPNNWDAHLPAALFAFRTTANATTKLSPFQLVYGRLPRLPIDVYLNNITRPPKDILSYEDFLNSITDLRLFARMMHEEDQTEALATSANYTNPYRVNDLVWLYTPVVKPGESKKFTAFWHGPYKVITISSPVNCIISDIPHTKDQLVHITRLKVYRHDDQPEGFPQDLRLDENLPLDDDQPSTPETNQNAKPPSTIPPPDSTDDYELPDVIERGKEYFEAERILDMKVRRKNGRKVRYYLVKWKNFPDSKNSWEPYYSLTRTTLIKDYHLQKDTPTESEEASPDADSTNP